MPEGIDEILPEEADHLEYLGRRLLDLFGTWGYRRVIPPLIDFLDSLRIGTGRELDLQTFKLTDPESGRLIGLRADMTPQVARIDARTARENLPARLCYTGSVLHAHSRHLEKSRNPLQIGAEIYGHAGHMASVEVISLMLEMLELAGVRDTHLDLGHVGIYRDLAAQAGFDAGQEARLFEILQRKNPEALDAFLKAAGVRPPVSDMLIELLHLNGPAGTLAEARQCLADAGGYILNALTELEEMARIIGGRFPSLPINVDLAELRGYHYHTGVVFAAFVPGLGREIARGGRYDDIGQTFGQARPAVGFSADLKLLARLSDRVCSPDRLPVFAPAIADPVLEEIIRDLRAEGHIVIRSLGSSFESPRDMGCVSELRQQNNQWQVVSLNTDDSRS